VFFNADRAFRVHINLIVILSFYLVVNLLNLVLFWWDKRAARLSNWRVPESKLLLLALFGGFVGAFIGQNLFRHKTQKQPFKLLLWLAATVHLAIIYWVTFQLRTR
jgi:uncharacterized membrane protein YsdA (DUF1294 family)